MIIQIQLNLNCFTSCESSINERPDLLSLFPEVSFFNHSCRPNLVKIFSNFKLTLQTSKIISEGEELTINYTSFMTPYFDRVNYLEKNYGFKCKCKLCIYEKSKDYFRNLHKSIKKKLGSLSFVQFTEYFKNKLPTLEELNKNKLLEINNIFKKSFYEKQKGLQLMNQTDRINYFLKMFIDNNNKNTKLIAKFLFEKDNILSLDSKSNEEQHLHKMLKLLNTNHAKIGNSYVGKFLKEITKIFGKKNIIIIRFITQIELELLNLKAYSACYEFTLWNVQVMKEYIEISGNKNLSVIGLLFFKLAKLERLMDRVDQAFIFADFGLKILTPYYEHENLLDLIEIKNESKVIIERFGINLDAKLKLLESKYLPNIYN